MKPPDIFDLYDLMFEQLRDLYDGEKQQMRVFPDLDKQAHSFELREVIEYHQVETNRQLERLVTIFDMLKESPEGEHCDGIKGLINETLKLAKRCKNPEVLDAGIITSIQHINHYEIVGYGTAIAYAKILDHHEIGSLLINSLREEKQADMGLSELATDQINVDAKWTSLVAKAESPEKQV